MSKQAKDTRYSTLDVYKREIYVLNDGIYGSIDF